MQVYCTKLCYLSGQVLEEDMIQDISSTILNDPYNSDVIYVTESDKPGYIQEISTAILLPIIGSRIEYVSEEVDTSDYTWKMHKYSTATRQSVPVNVMHFLNRDLDDFGYGVVDFNLYRNPVSIPDVIQYLKRYSNYDRRYQYLSSFFPDSSFVRSSRQDASSFRIKIAYTMRERNSIFSGAVSCPYQVNQTYFVPATYLEDGVKLPLKDRYESIEDFGQTIFYDLKFYDFQFSDTMLEKLCVKFGRDGKLREVRTKREIPYVYYQLDEKTGDATLMVNGREGTDNDLLSFFVFMPRDDKSLIFPSKLEIKEYKKHYADFPFKLNSYLEKNNVLPSSELLHTDDNISDEEEVLEDNSDNHNILLSFDDSTFSNSITNILKLRQQIILSRLPVSKKQELQNKLESTLQKRDFQIAELDRSILSFQTEAEIDNSFLKELVDIEGLISDEEKSYMDDFNWVDTYIDYLICESTDSVNNFRNLYYFSVNFRQQSALHPKNLLASLEAQNKIYEALFQQLLILDEVDQRNSVTFMNDFTIQQLSTVIDNHIDKITFSDGDVEVVSMLRQLNRDKQGLLERDSDFLRGYVIDTVSCYSKLDGVKVFAKKGGFYE